MNRYERGMLAISMAGHDRGKIYVIWDEKGEDVFLVDGDLRPIAKPKKKNRKHIQAVKNVPQECSGLSKDEITDEKIKYVLKCCRREQRLCNEVEKKREKFQEV